MALIRITPASQLARLPGENGERFAVAFEPHRAEAHVAENLRRARDVVRGLELPIRLFDLLTLRVLEERDAGIEVALCLLADRLFGARALGAGSPR